MDFSGLLTGTIAGFNRQRNVIEVQNRQDAEDARNREGKVYEALLNSDDEEARALGAAGLLHSTFAPVRKNGLQGWLGQMQSSPIMPQVQALLKTPKTVTDTSTSLPSTQYAGQISELPGEKPAALPSTSPTEVGSPPPNAPQPTGTLREQYEQHVANRSDELLQERPSLVGTPPPSAVRTTQQAPVTTTTTHQEPRRLFPTLEDQTRSKWRGELSGQVAGRVAAWEEVLGPGSHAEAVRRASEEMKHGGYGSIDRFEGNVLGRQLPEGSLDAYGRAVDPNTTYRRQGTQLFPVASIERSIGPEGELIARAMFGSSANLSQEQNQRIYAAVQTTKQRLTYGQALTHAQALFPEGTAEQKNQLAMALQSVSEQNVSATPGAPPPPAASVQPAGTTSPTNAPATPPATPAPTTSTKALPANLANVTKETGKPLPPQMATALASSKSTSDLIDRAIKALEPFKNDNTEEGGMKLGEKYRQGIFDPETGITAALADMAGIQAKNRPQLTAGSSRSMPAYLDRSQHVPKLPSVAATEFNQWLPTSVVGSVSRMRGGGWDSPKLMYEKLQQAKIANNNYIRDMEQYAAASERDAVGGPPPSAGGGYHYDEKLKTYVLD